MTHVLTTGCNGGIGLTLAKAALPKGWRFMGTSRTHSDFAGIEETVHIGEERAF